MSFTHLHVHSHYSLLNALPKIPDIVKRAKKYEMSSLALTDDGNLYAAIEFYKACKKEEIKPIIGVDFYVATRTRTDKVSGIDNRRYRLILLAKDEAGYQNLMKLVSLSHIEGFYYKPRIDRELISKYKEGLVCIIPQFSGETSGHLKLNNKERALEAVNFYKEQFGEDLYLEILPDTGIDGQKELRDSIAKFGKEVGVQIVACADTYYLDPEDKVPREVLVDVGTVKQGGGLHNEHEDFSFKKESDIKKELKAYPEALANTQVIADKCNLNLVLGTWNFPNFTLDDGETADTQLRKVAYAGFEKRGIILDEVYKKRIDYELEVIAKKGYSTYFLVVADLIRAAKEKKIQTNTRGSAAGCLTSYLAGITSVDPVLYKLPFERFLNPDRPSPPDIDLDIADDKRDEMIDYAREKYGEDRVAQIGTFGTMAARGAVRDVARAMGYPYIMGDKISKLIPMGKQGFPMYIDTALKEVPDLKELYRNDADVQKIINMAKKIEGCARHISVHAAGVVISPDEITKYTPVQLDPKGGKLITQFSMYPVEEAGLLKFDFLGLKNLTIIYEAIRRVRKTRGIEIDVETIPLDDQKTFEMVSKGLTYGVFQLASDGMTKWLKELRPTSIYDINAMVALYRPGPMEFIPEYIKRKQNPKLVHFLHPKLETILDQSFGVITYQDDVLMTAIDLAGYTWTEADKFRKAMGKKIPELMAEQKEKFSNGCRANGVSDEVITALWANIETFAAYGFNKAHAASYGRVAYQTAYLKANYPSEYMAALLTADSGDVERVALAVQECKKMGIPVLPPDVNESFEDFGVAKGKNPDGTGDTIRFGLSTIKNFGAQVAETIVEERKKNGLYKNLEDFLTRVQSKDLNKKSLEALTLAGGLDSLGDRSTIMANLDDLLEFAKSARSNGAQESLFSMMGSAPSHISLASPEGKTIRVKTTGMEEEIIHPLPLSKKHQLYWEKQLLGLYVTGHPLDKYKNVLETSGHTIRAAKLKTKGNVTLAGVIENIKEIQTKKGDTMAFLRISDFENTIEAVAFPETYKEFKSMLREDMAVALGGTMSKKDEDEVSILIDKVKLL